jgi:hypothetical protein
VQTDSWAIYAMRLLTSEECDPSSAITGWSNVDASGFRCGNGNQCENYGFQMLQLLGGPISTNVSPEYFHDLNFGGISGSGNSWNGRGANGESPWIEVRRGLKYSPLAPLLLPPAFLEELRVRSRLSRCPAA